MSEYDESSEFIADEYEDDGNDIDDVDDEEEIDLDEDNDSEESEDDEVEIDLGDGYLDEELPPDVDDVKALVEHQQNLVNESKSPAPRTALKVPLKMTKYELTAIIGYRAQQIAEGAKPYVTITDQIRDAVDIAIAEYERGLIPLNIERPFPTNRMGHFRYVPYRLDELTNLTRYK
jgi:DNA-directed RNA polymerase subunit K/omega